MADQMRHVLPPRIGGPITLMESGSDVLVLAHAGLGGFADIKQIWSGSLVGKTIHVAAWRYAAADIPAGRASRVRCAI